MLFDVTSFPVHSWYYSVRNYISDVTAQYAYVKSLAASTSKTKTINVYKIYGSIFNTIFSVSCIFRLYMSHKTPATDCQDVEMSSKLQHTTHRIMENDHLHHDTNRFVTINIHCLTYESISIIHGLLWALTFCSANVPINFRFFNILHSVSKRTLTYYQLTVWH